MSITIKEDVVVKTKDLVIKTPFYYKQDLLGEGDRYYSNTIYGEILDNAVISIQITKDLDRKPTRYAVEIDPDPYWPSYLSYFKDPEHKSNREEFVAALLEYDNYVKKSNFRNP